MTLNATVPPETDQRLYLGAFALLGVVLLALYLATMPPQIVLEDASSFTAACATLGLPHPPGYPLHTLSCYPLLLLGSAFGLSLAQGAALASALAAAGACVLLAVVLRRLCGCAASALLAAGSLGLAPAFWSQAIIPEAYALNVLLLTICLALAERAIATGSARYLVALAFAGGLGLANHWPLFLLAAPAIVILLLLRPQLFAQLLSVRLLAACCVAFGAGLLPYVHLLTVDPESFLFKVDYTNEDFFKYVSRFGYQDIAINLTAGARAFGLLVTLSGIVVQHAYLLGLIALGGLALLLRAGSWVLAATALWGMLSTTVLLALVRDHDFYDSYSKAVFAVYPLPAYMFATLPLAFGLGQLFGALKVIPKYRLVASVIVLVALGTLRFDGLNRSGEDFVAAHSRHILANLEPNTTLLLDSSDARMPLRFFDYFEGDGSISIVRDFDYFYDYANEDVMSTADSIAKLEQESAPLTSVLEMSLPTLGQRYYGTHYSLAKDVAPGKIELELDASSRAILEQLIVETQQRQRNFHSVKFTEDNLIVATAQLLGASSERELASADQELLDKLLATTPGSYANFYTLILDPASDATSIENAARELELRLGKLSVSRRATVFRLLGEWQLKRNDLGGALVNLENAVAVYPSAFNQRSIKSLLLTYAQADLVQKYAEFRQAGPLPHVDAQIERADAWCAQSLGRSCL